MKLLPHPLLLILTLFPSGDSIPTLNYDKKLSFVSGTFAEYLPDPLFYDSYVPLLYEFQVPRHSENALKIMWQHATVCNESDSRYSGKLCPVVFHLHKIVANLSAEMGFWKDFLPPSDPDDTTTTTSTPLSKSSKDKEMEKDSSLAPNFCRTIAPHFLHYFMSQEQIDVYLKSLEKCPLGENTKVVKQPSNWVIDKKIYYTMVDRFYTEFYRTLPATGNVDWVTTLNSYTTLSGILLSNNYIESNRVMSAILECQRGHIPHSFIKLPMLQQSLSDLEPKVHSNHYQLLLNPQDISQYYKLPLADCTFTPDFKLLIRLQIPLRMTEVSSKFVQLNTHPFVQRSKEGAKLCRLASPQHLRLVESSSGLLLDDDGTCKSNELCKRSDLNSYTPSDSCLSSILTNNDTMIRSQCDLNCYDVDSKSLPLFQRKSADTFIVVGTSDDKIFIQCNGQPLEQIVLSNLGALEVKLSCGCQISYRNLVFGSLEGLCSKEPVGVKHILPLHWNLSFSTENHVDLDERGILSHLEEQEKEKDDNYYKYKVGDDKHKTDKQVLVQQSGGGNEGIVVQLCLLWVIVVGLVGVCIVLSYQYWKLNKWKQIQIYKDTRIVYSVPASPQFPHKF